MIRGECEQERFGKERHNVEPGIGQRSCYQPPVGFAFKIEEINAIPGSLHGCAGSIYRWPGNGDNGRNKKVGYGWNRPTRTRYPLQDLPELPTVRRLPDESRALWSKMLPASVSVT